MNVDLSKLTPAPWEADGFANSEDMWDIGHPCADLKGRDDFRVLGIELTKADAEFIALARNAFAFWYEREPETAMKWLTDTETWYREAE